MCAAADATSADRHLPYAPRFGKGASDRSDFYHKNIQRIPHPAKRRWSARISSAMLVRESRTSSANGAFGRQAETTSPRPTKALKTNARGSILPRVRPREDRSGRLDTQRCRVPTRHLWGQGKAAGLTHGRRLCCGVRPYVQQIDIIGRTSEDAGRVSSRLRDASSITPKH